MYSFNALAIELLYSRPLEALLRSELDWQLMEVYKKIKYCCLDLKHIIWHD